MERLAAQSGTDALKVRYRALHRLCLGDRDGAAALLRELPLEPAPDLAETLAWQCVLGRDALADPAAVVETARAVSTQAPGPRSGRTLGAALHRAGREAEAIAEMEASGGRLEGPGAAQAWAFLGLAHQAQGNADAARLWLRKLDDRPPSHDPRDFWDELRITLLRREAESGTAAGAAARGAP
jgi:hypothetical protein